MQRRRLLFLLISVLFIAANVGVAELTPSITEDTHQNYTSELVGDIQVKSLGESFIHAEVNEHTFTERLNISNNEGIFGSDSQTLLSHRDPYTRNPLETVMESPGSRYSSLEGSLSSFPRPLLRPLLLQRSLSHVCNSTKSPVPNIRMLATHIHGRKIKTNSSDAKSQKQTYMQRPKSHHQLKPTAVSSTTTLIPEVKHTQKSSQGVLINPKGKERILEGILDKTKMMTSPSSSSSDHSNNSTSEVTESALNGKADVNPEKNPKSRSNFRSGSRLSQAMLRKLTSRSSKNNFKRESASSRSPIRKVHHMARQGQKKIVKKNIPKLESDEVLEEEIDTASPSVPLVIITTQTPLIKKVMHKKLIESSKMYKTPSFIHRGSDGVHEPLHSMYGPPYDHYKISAHRSPGRSFPPPPFPFYHSNHEFLHERFVQTQVPRLFPTLKEKYPNESDLLLPPYFREETIYPSTTPAPSLTLRPPANDYSFIPPKKNIAKALTYEIDDPYFHPDNHIATVKKTHSIVKAKVQAIKPIVTTTPPRKGSSMPRYSAVSDGIPGVDYPMYARIPYTSFSCKDDLPPGIYGDVEAGCQVWHMCEADGRQHSFLCPNGTIFNQELLTCDWWYNVYCSPPSDYFYKEPLKDIYKPLLNHLQISSDNFGKSLSIPEEQKKSNWSPFSNLNLTKRPDRESPSPPHLEHRDLPPPLHEKPSILSPRDIKGIVTPITGGSPPIFMEFQPYHQDSYPMFQIRKRHVKKI